MAQRAGERGKRACCWGIPQENEVDIAATEPTDECPDLYPVGEGNVGSEMSASRIVARGPW